MGFFGTKKDTDEKLQALEEFITHSHRRVLPE